MEGNKVDKNGQNLNLTDLLPRSLDVVAGERTYHITTDLPATLAARISHWFASYGSAMRTDGEALDENELWVLVAQVLGCDQDEARELGFAAAMQLLAFLTRPLRALVRTTPLSVPPSTSPSPTEAV